MTSCRVCRDMPADYRSESGHLAHGQRAGATLYPREMAARATYAP
jgi:hypothetical protein